MKKKQKPIYIILGTRAQIIKMAPIMSMLEDEGIEYELINTEQHVENMDILLQEFGIKTKLRKLINNKNEAKSIDLFGKWMFKIFLLSINPLSIRKVFNQGRGIILTHGDTATTAWAAIYGKLCLNKVMHIEAGMRSHNLRKPFPEELMRRITGLFSDYHMCPDEVAVNNLKHYPGKKFNTGANTLYDSIMLANNVISTNSKEYVKIINEFKIPQKYALVSIHRYENIFKTDVLNTLVDLIELASTTLPLVFILHPSTKTQLIATGLYDRLLKNKNITFLRRLEFIDFVALSLKSECLLTDSGGNQQEMYYLGIPTLLLRDITESNEGLGTNLVISNYDKDLVKDFMKNYKKYRKQLVKYPSPSELIFKIMKEII